MSIPSELRYSKDHEWVRVEGDRVVIGITDFAQDSLGDVVFVEAPEIGRTVAAGESFTEVESTKSVSDIYAPVSGEIVAVNTDLEGAPETMNSDPYGAGWICAIQMSDSGELDALMNAEAYAAFTAG
jgi:glycine cleavage system H protein